MLSTQVSQMVLSAHLNFQCTKTTNRYISSFDRFTDYYNRMSKKFQKAPISESSGHKNDKSCYQLIWPFYGLLQP